MDITAKDSIFQKEGGLGLSIMGLNSYPGLPIKKFGSFVGSYNAGHSYLMTRINNRDDSEFKTQNGFAKLNIKLNKSNTMRVLGLFDTYDFAHEDGFNTNSNNVICGLSITSMLRKNLVTRFIPRSGENPTVKDSQIIKGWILMEIILLPTRIE